MSPVVYILFYPILFLPFPLYHFGSTQFTSYLAPQPRTFDSFLQRLVDEPDHIGHHVRWNLVSHAGIDNVFEVETGALEPATSLDTLLQPIQERLGMLIADQLVTPAAQVQDPLVSKTPGHDRHQRLPLPVRHLAPVVKRLLAASPPQPTAVPQQARRVDLAHLIDEGVWEIRAPQERPALGLEPGPALAQPRPVGHDAHVVRAAYRHHGGREARVLHDDVPRRVAAQRDTQHHVLDDVLLAVGKNVRREVIQQHARVDGRAREAAKHVLSVSLVAAPPRLVRDGHHESTAVVPLVEGDRDQTQFLLVVAPARTRSGAVIGDDVCRERGHALVRLEPRVKEPQDGDVRHRRVQFGQPIHRREDARDVVRRGGYGFRVRDRVRRRSGFGALGCSVRVCYRVSSGWSGHSESISTLICIIQYQASIHRRGSLEGEDGTCTVYVECLAKYSIS